MKIVGEERATIGANERKEFQKDHVTLVEPEGPGDEVNVWVRNNLKACIEGTYVCTSVLGFSRGAGISTEICISRILRNGVSMHSQGIASR
jgi:hypothetical protein